MWQKRGCILGKTIRPLSAISYPPKHGVKKPSLMSLGSMRVKQMLQRLRVNRQNISRRFAGMLSLRDSQRGSVTFDPLSLRKPLRYEHLHSLYVTFNVTVAYPYLTCVWLEIGTSLSLSKPAVSDPKMF